MKKNYNISIDNDIKVDLYPIVVRFENDNYVYDFSIFKDTALVRLFAKAFQNRYAQFAKSARYPVYMHLKVFFNFFNEKYESKPTSISSRMMADFAIWLDNKNNFSLKTKYRYYNNLEVILKEVFKITNSPIKTFNLQACPFRDVHSETTPKTKLTEEQISKLLKICYQKIDESINDFRLGKEFIKNSAKIDSLDVSIKEIKYLIPYFYQKYGYLPSAQKPFMTNKEAQYVCELGGVDKFNKYLNPTVDSLLPFYIVLIIELAGNPEAIRDMKIDCIAKDLIFEDRAVINWNKPRANKIQSRNTFKKKKYGAYQIIELLKEFTSLIREKASEEDGEYLFISRISLGKKQISKLSNTNKVLMKFKENNALDFNFNLEDLRASVLTLLYKKRKDVVAVSKIANHANLNTTLSYIVDQETKKQNQYYLAEKQDNIIGFFTKKEEVPLNKIILENSESIGFTCKNPIKEENVCINWMAELTNPNLVIPNNHLYLAKILKLKTHIEEYRDYITKERFELLYGSVLETINIDILPKFSKKTLLEANKILDSIKLPSLNGY